MLHLLTSLSDSLLKTGLSLTFLFAPMNLLASQGHENIYQQDAKAQFFYYKDLFSCIDAPPVHGYHPKWDFSRNTCTTGRRWISLPESLKPELNRPLHQAEVEASLGEMKVSSPSTIAKEGELPRAIILIGAGASGKSSMCNHLDRWVNDFDPEEFVQFDGDILRKYHKGFLHAIKDDSTGYSNAWHTLKPHIFDTKEGILDTIIAQRRNVMIPTGVHAQKYYRIMSEAGYRVSVVGVFVDFKRALYQGRNRAEYTGREYLGDREAWETGVFDMVDLSQRIELETSQGKDQNSGRFGLLIDNRNFFSPELADSSTILNLAAE